MRMQDKIMAAIKSAIENKGYEFVQKANFPNCGSVFIQKTDGFTSFLEFFYDFQDLYVSFEFTKTTPKKSFHMFYSEGDKIASFIATVCSELPIIKTPRKKTPAPNPKKILVEEHGDGYKAYLESNPEISSTGSTTFYAIGMLLRNYAKVFGFEIKLNIPQEVS